MSRFAFAGCRLDTSTRELVRDGVVVALPARAFDGLVFLLDRRERAVGRDEFIDAIWGGRAATDVQLAQLILQCRRAIGDDGQAQRAIRTVAGFGYRWVMPLDVLAGDVDAPSDTTPAASDAGDADAASLTPIERSSAVAASASPATTIEPGSDPASAPPHAGDAHMPDVDVAANALATSHARARRYRAFAIVCACVVALVAAFAVAWFRGKSSATEMGRAVVLPLRVEADDAAWLRLGGLDVVVERLRRNRVPVLSSEASVALLQNAHVDTTDAASSSRRLRAAAGAGVVVAIRARRDGTRWHVDAELDDGAAAPRHFDVQDDDPIAALRALADRVSGALGQPVAEGKAGAANPALELTLQQARAALLANEPDRARTILLADAALVRDEPLLRQQLADVDIRAGRYAQARATLDELIARAPADARLRAQLLNARGLVSVREGHFAEAGADFGTAIDALGRDGDAITLGRAHLGRGISRTSLQDYGGALADDAQAREAFERAGDLGSVARVDSNIGALEILRGHMALAETYLARALARLRDLGFVQEQVNTLQLSFVAARAQLERDGAERAIAGLDALRERIVSPSSRWSTGLYRAEWFIWSGRLAEATASLDTLAASAQPAANAEAERLHLLRATLARSAGQPRKALAELAGIPDDARDSADDDSVRADVTLLRARLHRDLGLGADAGAPAPATIATPNPRTPLRLLADADARVARGDAGAERAFAAALALADDQGVAETIVAVVVDYATFLLDQGRFDDASALAGRIAVWADADFECALLRLRLARAKRDRAGEPAALEAVHRLAGERTVPPA